MFNALKLFSSSIFANVIYLYKDKEYLLNIQINFVVGKILII